MTSRQKILQDIREQREAVRQLETQPANGNTQVWECAAADVPLNAKVRRVSLLGPRLVLVEF